MSHYPLVRPTSTEEARINALVAADPACEGSTCVAVEMTADHGWLECSLQPLHEGDCTLT